MALSVWSSSNGVVASSASDPDDMSSINLETPPAAIEILSFQCAGVPSGPVSGGLQNPSPGMASQRVLFVRTSCQSYEITARVLDMNGRPVGKGYVGVALEVSQALASLGSHGSGGTLLVAHALADIQPGGTATWKQATVDAEVGQYLLSVVLPASFERGIPIQVRE